MKNFGFGFDVIGKGTIEIKAETLEEAIEILKGNKEAKEEPKYILDDWDMDLPDVFRELEIEDLKGYLAYEDEE